METWMKILKRPVTTLKDSQRLGRWDRLEVYPSDSERPWKTANDPVVSLVSYGNSTKYLWWPPTTLKDRQRLAVSRFGAKSSNLNEDFERPLTTMKDCQRPWKTANNWQWFPTTQILQWLRKTVNDTQRPVTTIWKPGYKLPAACRATPLRHRLQENASCNTSFMCCWNHESTFLFIAV